jgi:cytochrome P450/nitrite reductase/ring-hydroxylating ferredoxin subunit
MAAATSSSPDLNASNASSSSSSSSSSGSSPRWERVARVDDLKDEGPHALSAGGIALVALKTSKGKLKIFEGRCPHQGALLGEGDIEGNAIVCRNHRWKFDRDTGERVGGRQCLMECPTELRGDQLWVDLEPLLRRDQEAPQAPKEELRELEDLPGPRRFPLLGNTLQINMARLHLQVEEWANVYGRMYYMRLGPRPVLVVNDAEVAEQFFRERPETYRRVSDVETVFSEMSAAGVFSAEGDAWRAQRRLAMEALANRNLRGFYPTLTVVASRLVRRWEQAADDGKVLDIAEELKRFTVDVTTALVFGHDMNTLEKGDDIIQRHLEKIFPAFNRRLNAFFPYWRYIRLPKDRELERSIASLREWITNLVADARKKLAAEPNRPPANFLEAMLIARDLDGAAFSDDIIFGNALTMLLAGEDTTAYTLAWCVHHLCEDRRATDALRSELDATLGAALQWPKDIEQAGRLVYANGVANESMRLRAVAPTIFHEPLRDVVVEDVLVPKGTMIISLSRLPTLEASKFREPMSFIPERWLPGWEGPHETSAHVPFGSGPRICPGRSLAILEMRVVLAALYKNFVVERVGRPEDTREVTSFTMMPKGLLVLLRRRQRQQSSS